MKTKYIYRLISLFCLWLMFSPQAITNAHAKDFTLVIDPGHGGYDPGAVGKFSKEKNINLSVALKFGQLIEKNCSDVRVIYTRKKDTFVALNKRAEIANKADANLFISIHTNALGGNHTITGASTWTLGLAKSKANLEVAKRENAVILYEDDYKTSYAGFDPNSSESYIIFEFLQDQYMKESVYLVSLIQKEFKNKCRRRDKGVHQAGFLVLKANAMPSVLVELGFISTPKEEQFLNSKRGINTMANGLYHAFLNYKKVHKRENTPTAKKENCALKENEVKNNVTFALQLLASSEPIPLSDHRLKGLKGCKCYKEGKWYKILYGETSNYQEAVQRKREINKKFKDAFIVAYNNNHKISVTEAIQLIKTRNNEKY